MPLRKVAHWLRHSGRRRAQDRRFESALQRLAQREVTDTVAEEEVQAWMSLLEGGEGTAAGEAGLPRAARRSREEPGGG